MGRGGPKVDEIERSYFLNIPLSAVLSSRFKHVPAGGTGDTARQVKYFAWFRLPTESVAWRYILENKVCPLQSACASQLRGLLRPQPLVQTCKVQICLSSVLRLTR